MTTINSREFLLFVAGNDKADAKDSLVFDEYEGAREWADENDIAHVYSVTCEMRFDTMTEEDTP